MPPSFDLGCIGRDLGTFNRPALLDHTGWKDGIRIHRTSTGWRRRGTRRRGATGRRTPVGRAVTAWPASVWRTEASWAASPRGTWGWRASASWTAPKTTVSPTTGRRHRVGWPESARRAEGSAVERESRQVRVLRNRGPGWTAADGGRRHLVAKPLSVRPPPRTRGGSRGPEHRCRRRRRRGPGGRACARGEASGSRSCADSGTKPPEQPWRVERSSHHRRVTAEVRRRRRRSQRPGRTLGVRQLNWWTWAERGTCPERRRGHAKQGRGLRHLGRFVPCRDNTNSNFPIGCDVVR